MGSELQLPLHRDGAGPWTRDSELDRLKGNFLASLNHEIRTPLSGILGMVELLLETSLNIEQREYVRSARDCASQLLDLLNSILEYSALSAGSLNLNTCEYHLPQLLENIAGELRGRASAKGLAFRESIDPALPECVVGDARRLRQLALCIGDNAVKFTRQGEVRFTAALAVRQDRSTALRLSLSDTGIGIAPEKLAVIFESFRQVDSGLARNFNGLGLGLALAERIARLMGGRIDVSSRPGFGSTFQVLLPLALPEAADAAPMPAACGATGQPRVLMVEDNSIARQVVRHILSRHGFEVQCASSGEEGLEMAGASRFDLVLMDLQMPGMDGLQTATAMRSRPGYAAVPILALTANCSDENRAQCRSHGMQGFLSKPIRKEELLRAVEGHLRKQ